MGIVELNLELCRALGVTDVKCVRKVTLTLEPLKQPAVVVERDIDTADGLQTAVEMLRLQPVAVGGRQPAEPIEGDYSTYLKWQKRRAEEAAKRGGGV